MRHRPSTVLLASLALFFLPSASSADVCESGNSSSGSWSFNETCTGPLQPINRAVTFTVWSTTNCRDGGWRSHDNPSGLISGNANGVCGANEPYDPCHGDITGPYNVGGNGSTYQFTLDVSHGYWTGYGCAVGERQQENEFTASEGCTGGFCCGLENESG